MKALPLESSLFTLQDTERFWGGVLRTSNEEECWFSKRHYFTWKGLYLVPARVAFVLAKGPLTEDDLVCHTCDIGQCCTPSHLFKGTQVVNMQDMIQKGRGRSGVAKQEGEDNPNAKFTQLQIALMREAYTTLVEQGHGKGPTSFSCVSLAVSYNTSPEYVYRLVRGDYWAIKGTPKTK